MNHRMIKLDDYDKIKRFVKIADCLDYDLDLKSGDYNVNGKAIMGILSLDLSKPITVSMIDSSEFPEELEEFVV